MSELKVTFIDSDSNADGIDGRVTFEIEEGAEFMMDGNRDVQVIDLGDPNVSQEVEVVTVDAPTGRDRRHTTPPRMASRSSTNSVHNMQNVMQRNKTAPALLRNSRRFQSQPSDQFQIPYTVTSDGEGSVQNILGLPSQGASVLPPASATFLTKQRRQSTASASTSNIYGSPNDSVITHAANQSLQHAVLLDENGQPTDEYVVLAPTESGEYSIVDRSSREEAATDFFNSSNLETDKNENMNLESQGQTIIICQDPDSNQLQHVIEDEDGNFIPIEASNFPYQMEDGTIYLDEASFDASGSIVIADASRISKQRKKFKKPLQVIIGPDGKPVKKKGQTELKCMEKGCIMTCFNVAELRKHLGVTHGLHFDEETISFSSDKEFKLWRETYERERMVSFIYRGGTKKIAKDQAVTYMICHRSGHYKPTMGNESQRKRKMKPQGSCKMGGYCTAGIKLLKNLETGVVKMDICHTHYGHPLDSDAIPHLRVNPTLRKVILAKFQQGCSFTDVLAYIHHNPDRLEGLRLVDRRAVRNIFDTWKHPTRRSKQAQKDIDDLPPVDEDLEVQENAVDQEAMDDEDEQPNIHIQSTFIKLEPNIAPSQYNDEPPSLMPVDSARKPRFEDMEIEDSGPPLLVRAIEQATNLKNDDNESDEDESETETPTPVTRSKRNKKSVSNTTVARGYGLRPNRKVEVYSTPKPPKASKRSKDETPDTSDPVAKKSNVKVLKSPSPEKRQAVPKKKPQKSQETEKPKPKPQPPAPPPVIISQNLLKAIEKLIDHSESGPTVLLYKPLGNSVKYGETNKDLRKDDFCVVLQTPVQRQLLQMFPNIIGFEVLDSPKPSENQLKLAFLMVLDEFREAIPVAWIVANSVEPRIIGNFFKSVRHECGELQPKYLMSPRQSDAHKLWCSAFSDKPLSIQNDIEVKRDLKILVWHEFSTDKGRREIFEVVESLLIERQPENLDISNLEEKFEPLLDKYPHTGEFIEKLEKDWLCRVKEWALCYRFGTDVNVMGTSNSFSRLKKFVSFKGTKNLNESFEHILKIGYDKCFLRSKRMFKGDQKHSQFLDEIKNRHLKGRALQNASVEIDEMSEGSWIVCVSESKSYVVSNINSPCNCKLLCKYCKTCVHMYICTCSDFQTSQIMCEHIHLVHCDREGIEDEPEFISGDINPRDELEMGAFGKIETSGTEENPGAVLDLEAVLKAAGLFHRSDGLQPDQIVSITDADTHRIIYEHNPSAETSKPDDESQETEGSEPEGEFVECEEELK